MNANFEFEKCRGCMSADVTETSTQLFETEIGELFCKITELKIDINDELPKVLCSECVDYLDTFQRFKERCQESEAAFKMLLKTKDYDPSTSNHKVESDDWSDTDIKPIEIVTVKEENYGDDHHQFDMNSSDSESVKSEIEKIPEKKAFPGRITKKRKYKPKKIKIIEPKSNYIFPFICQLCNKGFRYKERYNGHLREHEGKPPAQCEFCDSEFTQWSGLQKHVEKFHEKDMHHVCLCGKKFMYKSGYDSHRCKFIDRQTFMCEDCGKTFDDRHKFQVSGIHDKIFIELIL